MKKKKWLAALSDNRTINARRVQAICYLSLLNNVLAVTLIIILLIKKYC